MNKSRIKYLLIHIFILSGIFSAGSFAADNAKNDTLALVGKRAITTEDFISSYKEKLRKIGLTDNGDTRINYLNNLVSDELLIAEAKTKGLDKTESAQKEYKRIRLQELLNEYSDTHISPTIHINLVTFSVEGEGKLIGVDNGNPQDHNSYKINKRNAFNGLCFAIVQSTQKAGKIKITVESDGLKGETIEINSIQENIVPALD